MLVLQFAYVKVLRRAVFSTDAQSYICDCELSIMEAAISKTPILSTDVGVASEILHKDSIFEIDSFSKSIPYIEHAYQNSLNYTIPEGLNKFDSIFSEIYES